MNVGASAVEGGAIGMKGSTKKTVTQGKQNISSGAEVG